MRAARLARLGVGIAVLPAALSYLYRFSVPAVDASGFVQFLVVMAFVSLLDVFLPHGDSVDVDTPLVVASLFLFGPAATTVMILVSRLVAHIVRNGGRELATLLHGLLKRLAALVAAAGALDLLRSSMVGQQLDPYIELLFIGAAYIIVQLVVGQLDMVVRRGDSLFRTLRGSIAIQSPVLAASASIGVLTVIVHEGMGVWGLVVTLFLVVTMRQSFALFLDVRKAYQATIETLIGAMEIQSPEEKGLGEKVARLARIAGAELGWFGRRIEHMGYAALLVHYGLSFKRFDSESGELLSTPLADVEFLRPVEPIVSLVKGDLDELPGDAVMAAAYLVSRAFGYVHGYDLQASERIASQLDDAALAKANKAFERARARAAAL
jgi:hypothetical protein